jgi:uncharacterized protein YggT (Ycf19 family)
VARKLLRMLVTMTTSLIHPRASVTRRDVVVRVARLLDYLFGLLYALLAIRLVLEMVGARRDAGFSQFIASATNPFYAPFKGIVATNTLDGSHPIVWALVIAIVAYVLLHAAIRGLLRLVARG